VRTLPSLSLLAGLLALAPGCRGQGGAPVPEPVPPPAPPTVALVSPAAALFARAGVAVQLDVGGGPADGVELLRDGAVLARLSPPYAYGWDTTAEPEGTHQLQARALGPGGSAESATVTVVVDRTPPRVRQRSPGPDENGVAASAEVRVEFDEPLLPASVTAQSLGLTGPGATPLAATVSLADERTLAATVPPLAQLPATLTATLGAGLTDRAGNPAVLPPEPSWSFTLPAWLPLGAKLTSPGWGGGTEPAVAVDPSGAVWCAWIRTQPDAGMPITGKVVVQRWSGTSWEQVGAPLDGGADSSLLRPAMALDDGGAPVVMWGNGSMHRVVRWDGQEWVALGSDADLAYSGQVFSFLAPRPGGLLAGWSNVPSPGVFEGLTKLWNGAGWSDVGQPVAVLAEAAAEHAGEPWMAGFANGSSHLWRWDGDGKQWVKEGTFTAATIDVASGAGVLAVAFPTPTSCPGGSCASLQVHLWSGTAFQRLGGDPAAGGPLRIVGRARVRVGPTGLPVVAWNSSNGSGTYVTVSEWDGAAWRPAELSMGGVTNPVSLALDPAGVPVFAAATLDQATSTVHSRVFRRNR